MAFQECIVHNKISRQNFMEMSDDKHIAEMNYKDLTYDSTEDLFVQVLKNILSKILSR